MEWFIIMILFVVLAGMLSENRKLKKQIASLNMDPIPDSKQNNMDFKINVSTSSSYKDDRDFSKSFEEGRTSKNLKDTPKNKLLKRLIDGESISFKCTKNSRHCIFSTENDRATGIEIDTDGQGNIMLESIFDVKIKDQRTITISKEGFSDTFNIHTEFPNRKDIKIGYYRTNNYETYKRENVSITLN